MEQKIELFFFAPKILLISNLGVYEYCMIQYLFQEIPSLSCSQNLLFFLNFQKILCMKHLITGLFN